MNIDEFCKAIDNAAKTWNLGSDGRTSEKVTPRLVRYWATQGWIDKPERNGREAVYNENHLNQALVVRKSQIQGLGSKTIGTLLKSPPEDILESLVSNSKSPNVNDIFEAQSFYSTSEPSRSFGFSGAIASGSSLQNSETESSYVLNGALAALDKIAGTSSQKSLLNDRKTAAPQSVTRSKLLGSCSNSFSRGAPDAHYEALTKTAFSIGPVTVTVNSKGEIPENEENMKALMQGIEDELKKIKQKEERK